MSSSKEQLFENWLNGVWGDGPLQKGLRKDLKEAFEGGMEAVAAHETTEHRPLADLWNIVSENRNGAYNGTAAQILVQLHAEKAVETAAHCCACSLEMPLGNDGCHQNEYGESVYVCVRRSEKAVETPPATTLKELAQRYSREMCLVNNVGNIPHFILWLERQRNG